VSVILDSLRRARGDSSAAADATGRRVTPAAIPAPGARPIPAGLRFAKPAGGRRGGGIRWKLLAPVLVIALGIWAIARLSMNLTTDQVSLPAQIAGSAATAPGADSSTGVAADASANPGASAAADAAKVAPTPQQVATAILEEFVPGVQLPKQTEMTDRAPVPSQALKGADRAAAAADAPAPPADAPKPAARAPEPRPVPPPEPPAAPATLPVTAVSAATIVRTDHFELGTRAQSADNFQLAQTHYLNAIAADDLDVGARNNLAMMYAARGLTTDAVDLLRDAIRIDPDYLNARSNLAVVLMNVGRPEEAKAQLRDAIDRAPRNVGLRVNLALVQSSDGQDDLARETLIGALGIDPTHADAHYNLATLYDRAGSVADAHEHYRKFLDYAGADAGERLDAVRRRIDEIAPRLDRLAR
jgi:Flp pilus assembly protein TadD